MARHQRLECLQALGHDLLGRVALIGVHADHIHEVAAAELQETLDEVEIGARGHCADDDAAGIGCISRKPVSEKANVSLTNGNP